ncbi:putative low-complexity protein [Actinobacteria bacterium IMCC26256]|nr:putative low-complexity protein [Actinobacteria bacterium IMCC26256]
MAELLAWAFDLDGTLADTAALTDGRRSPALILEDSRAGASMKKLKFSDAVRLFPARLMASGYRVGVITRSPLPYASTLLGLLRINYEVLLPADRTMTTAAKLLVLCERFQIEPENLVYMGDTEADKEAADKAGCRYTLPPWIENPTWANKDVKFKQRLRGRMVEANLGVESLEEYQSAAGVRLSEIRARIRLGESLDDQAVAAIRDSTSIPVRNISAKIAAAALLAGGPQTERAALQRHLLENVGPEARLCLVDRNPDQGLWGFPGTLLSGADLFRAGPTGHLKPVRNRALVSMFPVVEIPGFEVPVYTCTYYSRSIWGEGLWKFAKNWTSKSIGSGPEPRLSLIEFPATVIGAHVAALFPQAVITSVPSSPFSASKPAQVSERLAIRAAAAAGVTYSPLLMKANGGIVMDPSAARETRPVVLVEDQITTGDSVTSSLAALRGAGINVVGVVSWSASKRLVSASQFFVDNHENCWLDEGFAALGIWVECQAHPLMDPSTRLSGVGAEIHRAVLINELERRGVPFEADAPTEPVIAVNTSASSALPLDALDLFDEPVAAVNNSVPMPGADLTDANLRGANLENRDLAGIRLDGAKLLGANLKGANLEGAKLFNADLTRADLSGANLRNAYLVGVNFTDADLSEAVFSGAVLRGAELTGADLRIADLRRLDLPLHNLQGLMLLGANLSRANVKGSNLREANLESANLRHANLAGCNLEVTKMAKVTAGFANFENANMHKANLVEADLASTNLRCANLVDANLLNANLSNADLAEANLQNAKLEGANLTNATMTDANLVDANLLNANLSNADLAEANLQNAKLEGANLTNATMTDANLVDANLLNANLSNADLAEANLQNAKLEGANLTNATMTDADLFNANLWKVNLSGADLRGARLTFSVLDSADMRRSNLGGAMMGHIDMSDADLSGANLEDCVMWDPEVENVGSLMQGVNLSGANLRGADLEGSNLWLADLTDANLEDADLTNVDLTEADLTNANLSGTILTGVLWDETTIWPVGFTPPPSR